MTKWDVSSCHAADNDCQAYDVIIGSSFYLAVQQRPVLKDFLLTIVLEGLEDKYGILLSRGALVSRRASLPAERRGEMGGLQTGSELFEGLAVVNIVTAVEVVQKSAENCITANLSSNCCCTTIHLQNEWWLRVTHLRATRLDCSTRLAVGIPIVH